MKASKSLFFSNSNRGTFFADTLTLSQGSTEIKLLNTGIAWPSDKRVKFRNPPGNLSEALKPFSPPIFWKRSVDQLDPGNAANNGFQNEDLIVWMRTAALPSFRKLYRRLDQTNNSYSKGLKAGEYTLKINYSKWKSKHLLYTICTYIFNSGYFYFRLSRRIVWWHQAHDLIDDLCTWR